MASSFFKIEMWWLISAKVAHQKSYTFIKRLLLSFFIINSSDNRVSHHDAGTSQPCIFNFRRGTVIYCTIFIRSLPSCCLLKKIKLLMLFLSEISYLFINFGGANRNACIVIFTWKFLLYRTVRADGRIFSL